MIVQAQIQSNISNSMDLSEESGYKNSAKIQCFWDHIASIQSQGFLPTLPQPHESTFKARFQMSTSIGKTKFLS